MDSKRAFLGLEAEAGVTNVTLFFLKTSLSQDLTLLTSSLVIYIVISINNFHIIILFSACPMSMLYLIFMCLLFKNPNSIFIILGHFFTE